MSNTEDKSLRRNQRNKNQEDRTTSSSQETSYTGDHYSATSNRNNEDTHYNRAPGDDGQRTNVAANSSNEQNVMPALPSIDAQNWKCRECNFVNKRGSMICDTCKTPKAMRPLLESCLSYTKRNPSTSPTRRLSPSPIRAGSISPPTDRRKSSDSYSSDENQYQTSKNKIKRRSSPSNSPKKRWTSSESASSTERDRKHQKDYSKSENKKTKSNRYDSSEERSSGYTGGSYSNSSKYRSDFEKDPYQTVSPRKFSNRNQSRSPSSKENIRRRSPDAVPKERSSSRSPKFSDGSDRKRPEDDHKPKNKSIISKTSDGQPPSKIPDRDIVVYVPDLPPNIESSQTLENMIRQCLEFKNKQKILDVKCYTQLGVGIIYLYSEEDKHNLVNVIEKMIIETTNNTTISFIDELDLISYVVIDTKDMKNLPTSSEIRRKWVQIYRVSSEPKCEQLSVQFPNIFQIVTHSLDELNKAQSISDFSINGQFATVYFQADYCFFEDLPQKTNLDRLKDTISKQISDKYTSKDLMHIQYNKDSLNAVVITSGRARIWSLYTFIQLDERIIMKKDRLACRLLIKNVPKGLSLSLIRNHKIFEDSVANILPSGENAILEISDQNIYEKCREYGVLRIDDHVLHIEVYKIDPGASEINAETWYDTDMGDNKADIMRYVSNPDHPIFRMKWNSQAFKDQLHRWTSNERNTNEKDEKLCNQKRHLIRMTVMLNTIGVIKKDSYRIGDKEVKLKFDQLKTILYNHKSKLQRSKTIPLSQATEFRYKSTEVRVVNDDCLIVYKKLVTDGYRPVLLNMANANNPGGGYKRGDDAQEETIFRRSNYYQSLDLTLDGGKPSTRFYCNSNCEIEPLSERDGLYPMDEFGAIYTSGLTVFRLQEEKGYDYMETPMYDVCAIAMAAYRNPKTGKKDFLAPKYSIGTRKKIENIFAIAHQHKHDCLVLSAFGCGAFHNPPTHIASLFKSVIEQYAGFFKCIYFSIIDDHNTGQEFNPQGNYRPFQKTLDNLEIEPKRYKIVDMMIGPWKILNQTKNKELTLSDIRICYLPPCHYGGRCEDIQNEQHYRVYSHPPLCSSTDNTGSCKEKSDDQHMLWFRHRQKCSYGGECELIDNDQLHSNEFEHPKYCRDGGRCENIEREHLKSYRHVPLCRHSRQCIDYNRRSEEHCQNFRHCVPNCRFGYFCIRFHDQEHLKEENHPFKQPCPFTPFHCRDYNTLSEFRNVKSLPVDIQNHCLQYSHVCRFGRQCTDKTDVHWQNTIHVARHMCQYGDQCRQMHLKEHLNSFSHPGMPDIRRLCKHQGYDCHDRRNPEHIKQYRHHGNHDRSGVITSFSQNSRINFIENQENIIKAIGEYAKGLKPTHPSVLSDVKRLVKSLQPIHRCGKVIFESILVHGHVMSRRHMEHLKKTTFVAQAVQEHKRVRAIIDRYKIPAIEQNAKDYIEAIVAREYDKKYTALAAVVLGVATTTTANLPVDDDHDKTIRHQEKMLRSTIKPEEIDRIKSCAVDIAEASWNLHNSPAGFGFPVDKILDTDKHVFSILGPHLGHYYGDIFLVFKSELMLHPDANFSPQAATSFASNRTFVHRAWVKNPDTVIGRVKCFHESKLHCSIPGYENAAAAELIAITGAKKETMDTSLEYIFNRWKHVDSHDVFEAHLPQLVPLDYIEEVYIAKNLFASLTPAAQESAKKIFRNSLHITEHVIDLTVTGGGGSHPPDKSRSDYQDYVTNKIIEKFEKQMERTRRLYGTVITLAPSQFSDHIVLPLTITDAPDQHRKTHKHASNYDDTYIYWQAMYGDMMITLSNEQIDPYKSQPDIRYLVSYIAERPSTSTTNYNESYSYLNAGDPYRHGIIMSDGRCSRNSRTFHRGCNIDDFLTYCLKLEKKTGQVTLSHAGSNGIYCYETISYKFPKTTLDLNKLKYIHVSAGSQKVPIRNLTVSFEQIADLHPTFDKNFKQSDRNSKPSRSPSYGRTPCRYGEKCKDRDDPQHRSEYSHHQKRDSKSSASSSHGRTPCRYGEKCKDRDDPQHRSEYSHHQERDSKSSRSSSYGQTPCRYGEKCKDRDDPQHRSEYSHHQERDSKSSRSSSYGQTPCRYGEKCKDRDDPQHRSEYSHHQERDSKPSRSPSYGRTPCRYGEKCKDRDDLQHCSEYSHSHK